MRGRVDFSSGPIIFSSVALYLGGNQSRDGWVRYICSVCAWAWKTLTRKPVFNFVSEGRDFSQTQRVLILATSFYEYTTPKVAKGKLKDQHQSQCAERNGYGLLASSSRVALLCSPQSLDRMCSRTMTARFAY
jgi:hypothetical protein